jgi:hypothetical protein
MSNLGRRISLCPRDIIFAFSMGGAPMLSRLDDIFSSTSPIDKQTYSATPFSGPAPFMLKVSRRRGKRGQKGGQKGEKGLQKRGKRGESPNI